jgi:hypothetical protein
LGEVAYREKGSVLKANTTTAQHKKKEEEGRKGCGRVEMAAQQTTCEAEGNRRAEKDIEKKRRYRCSVGAFQLVATATRVCVCVCVHHDVHQIVLFR